MQGNVDKFNKTHLDFINGYAYELLMKFGYYDFFIQNGADPIENDLNIPKTWVQEFNTKNHRTSIDLQNNAEEVTSIYINYPALLLRKKSDMYPDGRTSHKFKNFMRKKVTIIDKNKDVQKDPVKMSTDVDEAEQEDDS